MPIVVYEGLGKYETANNIVSIATKIVGSLAFNVIWKLVRSKFLEFIIY